MSIHGQVPIFQEEMWKLRKQLECKTGLLSADAISALVALQSVAMVSTAKHLVHQRYWRAAKRWQVRLLFKQHGCSRKLLVSEVKV